MDVSAIMGELVRIISAARCRRRRSKGSVLTGCSLTNRHPVLFGEQDVLYTTDVVSGDITYMGGPVPGGLTALECNDRVFKAVSMNQYDWAEAYRWHLKLVEAMSRNEQGAVTALVKAER